jgi:CBS domain-containing protein
MQVSDVMTRDVETIPPDASLQQAAEAMEAMGVGSLPVCDGRRLVGTLTDRDIVVRGVATGRSPIEMLVRDCMTDDISYAFEEEDAEAVLARMKTRQVRRLAVLDQEKNLASPPSRAPRTCARSARRSPKSPSRRGRIGS